MKKLARKKLTAGQDKYNIELASDMIIVLRIIRSNGQTVERYFEEIYLGRRYVRRMGSIKCGIEKNQIVLHSHRPYDGTWYLKYVNHLQQIILDKTENVRVARRSVYDDYEVETQSPSLDEHSQKLQLIHPAHKTYGKT